MKVYQWVFYFTGIILPKNKHLIIFESFLGKQYSDNPRAIYEYMKQHYPHYDMYWSVERKSLEKLKQYDIKLLHRFSLRWLFKMNRAQYWVTNSRLPLWIPKPNKTTYVQTWHGTPLKRLAVDMDEVHMPGTNTDAYKRNFLTESSKWDYLISPNAYSTEIFRRAFQFDKTIIESGYPRNDFLMNENNDKTVSMIKQKLNINPTKKVILYAPTWRDNEYYSVGRYKFDIPIDLQKLQQSLGEDYVILLRFHYLIAEKMDLSQYDGFVYNVSDYEDIRELYVISDLLITDYSSVFFDYANLKRPVLFFTYDIEEYRDTLRGFYFDIEKDAPGPLVKTTEQLIDEIKRLDETSLWTKEQEHFYEQFCNLEDGQATERVVKKIWN